MNNEKIVLFEGKECGKNAKEIYLYYCDILGFDECQINKFGCHSKLYANTASKEGYGVWFLAHSNYTMDRKSNWDNKFVDSNNVIIENWKNYDTQDESIGDHLDTRIVFAKLDKQFYYFMGVYKYEHTQGKNKYFRRISKIYPIED
ncbi:MAG: hypothetical protein ACI4TX_00015 [Christensenellales bacterium]